MAEPATTYRVKANDVEFSFTREEMEAADLVQTAPLEFNVLKDHRSVNARITAIGPDPKQLTVEVEGESFAIQISEELDQLLEKMGFGLAASKNISEVRAPMPGMVLEIAVGEGQLVDKGEKILILAAMKMENSIVIHTSATIKRVLVSAGQAVEKGQVLVELE